MLTIARKRLEKDSEDGFTLIELMVVVLIIAILMAIAIPSFLSAQDRANDRSAQSNMRVGLTNARSVYTDAQTYPAVGTLVDALNAAEPNVAFIANPAAVVSLAEQPSTASLKPGKSVVYVKAGTAAGTNVSFIVVSKSDKCFTMSDAAGTTSAITEETDCTI